MSTPLDGMADTITGAMRPASVVCICTCGSGGHPRRCARHPEEFARHCADIDHENRDAVDLIRRERERLETILARHSRYAARMGRTDLAHLLDRLSDAITACGDDGAAPVELVCRRCAAIVRTIPADAPVPPCPHCDGALNTQTSGDL